MHSASKVSATTLFFFILLVKKPNMCGILALLNSTDESPTMRARVLALSRRQRHRGPDW